LVLTTLHTNDAAGAITRLDEMGVEPFMVSGALLGVVAQRLVRRVCAACRIVYAQFHGTGSIWPIKFPKRGSSLL